MTVFCYRIHGVLKAQTPLHIGSIRRVGVIKKTYPFIPGSFLRGAIGVSLMRLVCKLDEPLVNHEECQYFDECIYARLFGEEHGKTSKIFFRFSYPSHLGCGGVFQPAPKNLYRCQNPQCRKTYISFVPPEKCEVPSCDGSVKPYKGYVCSECGALNSNPVGISRLTLTAIDRDKASAAQIVSKGQTAGTLHTLEVIDRGSNFQFEIIVHPDMADAVNAVRNILERMLPDEGIGGSKSRGLGKVSVEDLHVEALDTGVLEKKADFIDDRGFTVRLLSPMVLEKGRSLEPSILLEGVRRAYSWAFHTGKPRLPEVKRMHMAVSGEMYSGWSLKTQRRRRLMPTLSAGSVFRFEAAEHSRELCLGLAALEYYALGNYKPHGFGQVRIERQGGM